MKIQDRIKAWHLRHFDCFPEACIRKAISELGELSDAEFALEVAERDGRAAPSRVRRAAEEAADVAITLYAWAARRGVDLDSAIAAKVAILEGRTPERIHRHDSTLDNPAGV